MAGIQLKVIHRKASLKQPKNMCGNTNALRVTIAVWLLQVIATCAQNSVCQNLAASPTLTMFVDQLPIPPAIHLTNATLSVGAFKINQKLHRDLPPTTLYAYGQTISDAMYPAATLEARRNQPAHVYYTNNIAGPHILPIDRTIHWANPLHGGVPIVTHLHGAEVQSYSDGHPDAWFTQNGDHGPTYTTQNYTYPNAQNPTMLWYHDHVVGITRLNVLAGLAGLYMLRSDQDQCLTDLFPYGQFEIPIVLKDLQFWSNGSINFPNIGDSPATHPQWCPEYFGDTIVVNGKAWPTLTVHPRCYRFRFLNGANARFFNISMSNPRLSFTKIATDGGYLPPGQSQVVKSLMIAPAERVDVIIDFKNLTPGSVVYFNNSAPAPFPGGGFNPPQTNSVMQIKVAAWPSGTTNFGNSSTDVMRCVNQASSGYFPSRDFNGSLHRYLTLQEFDDANGSPIVSLLGNKTWNDPVTELPRVNSTEVWEMINLTPDAHPIHTHLIHFQVLNQQPFDTTGFSAGTCNITIPFGQSGTCFTGPPIAPAIYQTGLKDTAIVWPGNVTRYGMTFRSASGGPFVFDPTTEPGYVWHCHILDHEDNDMMRPYKVLPAV
ncbi:hypothetical protein KC19_5G170500 [Ceratodon purpureus]|uniref:Laccase n=1 Tax=Ceratodon purpureus TaxID=3225 RepID=A0A8T0I528_CERPU|nr:hypothetical protein KC19_5G170500 [Ceratodon purpureus]KAG0577656.1 hypothetical protein KC19_5G170500 [Ceratodon purpureus]KAG0577657.1 hypothetical protein KC19_5G170500 [Ceratodon purpureus]KAG0577658.1 hypothetical protein KC19_5G170500 [Ceratodon purpureus]